ncbi:MAG TPA: RNA polymerase sigma factor [Chloroflexaceae bacterium]|nr:RNA polymerase sigma factor [Chloroflexaceae bacterium]
MSCLPEPAYDLPPSFEEVVARHQGHVHAIAYSVLRDWQDAEDVTQDVLLKVYLRLDELANPAALRSWLRRITVNACLDLLSYRRRRPPLVSLTGEDGREGAICAEALRAGSAEDAALRAEEWGAFQAALGRLDPHAYDALLLRALHGYSYAEIAELRNLSLSAAKMRVYRARQAIQQRLRVEGQ